MVQFAGTSQPTVAVPLKEECEGVSFAGVVVRCHFLVYVVTARMVVDDGITVVSKREHLDSRPALLASAAR